jgi:uncharacterized protein (TIGR00290 family)
MKNVLLSWSSGKDSAWAFHLLKQQEGLHISGLVTTFNKAADRVAMHAVRRSLVEAQADRIGTPLWRIELPWPCSNADYEEIMRGVVNRALSAGVEAFAFGDLFLQDIRDYRQKQLSGTGLEALFPLWGIPTRDLARDMISAGVKAKVTCVDPSKLDRSFAGCDFDHAFLERLPKEVDPCGENGEFHTFVSDAPFFSSPVGVRLGEIVDRDGFVFADLISSEEVKP